MVEYFEMGWACAMEIGNWIS